MREYYQYRVNGVGIKLTDIYVPFIEGAFMHYALKMYYRTGLMLRANMIKQMRAQIDELGPISEDVAIKLSIALQASVGAALGYKEIYRNDVDRKDNTGKVVEKGMWKVLFAEEPFSFEFEDVQIDGVIDLAVVSKDNNIIVENKYLTSVTADKYSQLPLDLQGLIYSEGFKAKTGEYPDLKGWNFILKTALRRKLGSEKHPLPETLEEYEARVQQQYVQEPDRMFFRPPPLVVSKKMIDGLKEQLHLFLEEFKRPPIMRFSSCLGMYGRPCPFIQACQAKLQGKADGWNAPECTGLYKMKEAQHEELKEGKNAKGKGK